MKLSKNLISLLTIISLVLLTIGTVSAADTNDTGLDDVISDIADINTTTPEISPNNHSSDSDEISEITINNPSNVDENNNINEFFEVKHTPKLLSSNTQKAQISNNILTTSSESQNNNFPESVETISMENPSIDELNSPIFELNTIQTNQLYTSTNSLQNTIASINDITIIVDDISGTPNENIKIPVQIYKNNIPVTTGNVIINLNDQIFDSDVVGGVATIPTSLGVGEYKLLAEYMGEAPFNSSSGYITVEVIQPIYKTVLILPDLTKVYLGEEELTGVLMLNNGEVIVGHHILLTLTRLSSGASKTYDVVTDYTGTFSLPINLAVGEYSAEAVFEGYGDYNPVSNSSHISVTNPIDNRTYTSIMVSDFSENYGEGKNYTGSLIDVTTGTAIIGHHVTVRLIRNSNGQYKDYDVVTDYTGTFILPINLGSGLYTAECSYAGTDLYQPSSASSTITVY